MGINYKVVRALHQDYDKTDESRHLHLTPASQEIGTPRQDKTHVIWELDLPAVEKMFQNQGCSDLELGCDNMYSDELDSCTSRKPIRATPSMNSQEAVEKKLTAFLSMTDLPEKM